MDSYGHPILSPKGAYIFLDGCGRPRSDKGWPYFLDGDGQLINGPDAIPLLIGANGKPVTSSGSPIQLDENYKPIFGENNLLADVDKNGPDGQLYLLEGGNIVGAPDEELLLLGIK